MAKTTHITLQQTEGFIVQAAGQIYAAYIASGKVNEGDESSWMKKAISEAIQIAKATDEAIIAESELS